jgi:hypothetical protein
MVVPVPPPPLLASHVAVRAAASAISHGRRVLLNGDHPPQVAALGRGDWVKLICGASFEVSCPFHLAASLVTTLGSSSRDCWLFIVGSNQMGLQGLLAVHSRVKWTGTHETSGCFLSI